MTVAQRHGDAYVVLGTESPPLGHYIVVEIEKLGAPVMALLAGCSAPDPDDTDESVATSDEASSGPAVGHAELEAAHAKIQQQYAFTAWKAIDWDAHLAEFLPLIAEADQNGERSLFLHAVRRYGHSLPDAHIEVEGVGQCEETAGGYGLVLSRLDDGSVAVVAVNGTADVAPGDRVITWNGAPIDQALAEAPSWCSSSGLATPEQREFEQLRWLVRAVPGTTVTATFAVQDEIELVASDDDRWSLRATGPRDRGDGVVSSKLLANDTVGYIHIDHVERQSVGDDVAETLTSLLDAGAESLVLDVRDNEGGSDQLAADIAGHFHATERFYETTTWWDADAGHDTVDETVWVTPQSPQWPGPVVVLVNHYTVSSGEGIAMAVGWSPQATVVGFEATAASFGMTGGKARIGDDIVIWFPLGKSLDEDGLVQLDSDHRGEGGVHPTVRVPSTLENRIAWATGGDPELDVTLELLKAR